MELERHLLSLDFPQFRCIRCEDQTVRVAGVIGPNRLCKKGYLVVGQYPINYPRHRPQVFCPEEEFVSGTPHLYSNQELCLEHRNWRPDDTMATALGWAAQWLAAYESYVRTGEEW